ncbi:MAG: DUF2238 domain-containing protein, partial [Planctomycetota bacterium]
MRLLLIGTFLVTVWSFIGAADLFTWVFELMLGIAGVLFLACIQKQFRFSNFFLSVVFIHYVILALGAHYTYAGMPLFDWLQQQFELQRNHFDRVGHFMQGLTPALVVVEWLTRRSELTSSRIISTAAISAGLAFSALYEVLEWLWVIVFYPDSGPEWLGMQGDPWDAQGDMFMALCGALLAVSLLSGFHRHSIKALEER